MMQYAGGTASLESSPPLPGSIQLHHSGEKLYRESIRKASVPGGQCRSALRFFPASSDTAAGEGACLSSASSASASPTLEDAASERCSLASLSFSSDGGDLLFYGRQDGVEELRDVALRMVRDGYMKALIRAFGAAAAVSSSSHCRAPRPDSDELLLWSWFSELDVEWVLHLREQRLDLEDGCASLLDLMEKWIKALKTMVEVLRITHLELRAKRPAVTSLMKVIGYFLLLVTGKTAAREQKAAAQFVRFAETSVLRMLDFVDAVADAPPDDDDDQATETTLPGMLQVCTCIVVDSPAVLALFEEASSTTSASMFDAMNKAFLRKRSRLSDAIWSMMEKVRASFLRDDCWRVSSSPDEAGAVHNTTRLMMNYVMLLWRNEGALHFVLKDQQDRFRVFLPEPDGYCWSSVADLIKNMIACLEKQLEKTSNFISDPGLRYVFLMNNCSYVSERVSSLLLMPFQDYKIDDRASGSRERLGPMEDCVNQPDRSIRAKIEMDSDLDGIVKIQSMMEAYLDASWEPVMSCLYHDIPRGFVKSGGALDKFESEFQRTCAMQRMWKVPNPELKKRLRKAVNEKVISGYRQYLTERTARGKSNRTPRSTPLELVELIEELFEG